MVLPCAAKAESRRIVWQNLTTVLLNVIARVNVATSINGGRYKNGPALTRYCVRAGP